jgi:DNA-binding FrmR family transcriptional regulator
MSHPVHEKQKLLNRIRRIRGQVQATEQAIESEEGCAAVMHQLVAVRGAINSLLAEVLEDHVREHLVGAKRANVRSEAADELIDIAHAYFRS